MPALHAPGAPLHAAGMDDEAIDAWLDEQDERERERREEVDESGEDDFGD